MCTYRYKFGSHIRSLANLIFAAHFTVHIYHVVFHNLNYNIQNTRRMQFEWIFSLHGDKIWQLFLWIQFDTARLSQMDKHSVDFKCTNPLWNIYDVLLKLFFPTLCLSLSSYYRWCSSSCCCCCRRWWRINHKLSCVYIALNNNFRQAIKYY